MLRPLVKFWVPDAFVISFKVQSFDFKVENTINLVYNMQLETDENILLEKARKALKKYGHKLVIANELNTRKDKVTLVTEDASEVIQIDSQQSKIEIEQLIVENVVKRHREFIQHFNESHWASAIIQTYFPFLWLCVNKLLAFVFD